MGKLFVPIRNDPIREVGLKQCALTFHLIGSFLTGKQTNFSCL
jgi:hypothetical protein